MRPLRGGLKLDGKKDSTLIPWTIARPSPPRRVRIPLEDARVFKSRVKAGERVRLGEKIAEAEDSPGLYLHASLSGKVSQVAEAIEILSDGKDEPLPEIGRERPQWETLSSAEIFQILRESGIDLVSPSSVDVLILNACESEPYLTSDHSLLMSHPMEILKAGEILRRALQAKEVVVVLEDNKEEVAELLKSKIFFHSRPHARVEVLPTRYPQDDERILTRQFGTREAGARVQDISSAYAVYEAVVLQRPFYERTVTISGECVAQPGNFWLRIGTLVEEAVKQARGFLREPARVILGGPMRGRALENLEEPVLKGTRAILGLPREVARPESVAPCIRCNRCVESCPVSISPVMITLAAEKDLFDLARDYGASRCIECGNCSYVCPANRPMVELIQYANAR